MQGHSTLYTTRVGVARTLTEEAQSSPHSSFHINQGTYGTMEHMFGEHKYWGSITVKTPVSATQFILLFARTPLGERPRQ